MIEFFYAINSKASYSIASVKIKLMNFLYDKISLDQQSTKESIY